jgi:diguanylate cyclase (GGDEF)-like protein
MKDNRIVRKLKSDIRSLRKELSQRTRELSFFIDSGEALTSTLEFNKILRIIIGRAQRLIKCEAWSLLLLNDEKGELEFFSVKGGRRRGLSKSRVKVGQGIAGWVAKNGKPLVVQDVKRNRYFHKAADQVAQVKTQSVLCVPIVNKSKTVGVLEMINKQNGVPFQEKDKELLTQLVDQAAIALERSSLYHQMADLAITDDLTKLFNFRHLYQTLDRELSRCERYSSVLSIIFFDMDYFKLVNDNHGHLIGSRVLIEIAQVLVRSLRNIDIIARYGGDEFVIVLPETSVKTAFRIATRLQRAFQEYVFLKKEGLKIQMTASFGVSGYPEHAISKNDLISLSDQAMYRAKNTGRNRICIAEPMTEKGQGRFPDPSLGGMTRSWPVVNKRSPKRSRRRSASS